MTIHGYNPHGTATPGAEYAREHPDELPDGVEIGKKVRVGRQILTIGKEYRLTGVTIRLLAATEQTAVVFDIRGADRKWLDKNMPEGRLLLWQGLYWRVQSVHGVFVTAVLFGTSRRLKGWVNFTRNGHDMVRPVPGKD